MLQNAKNPSDVLKLGDTITVHIEKFDPSSEPSPRITSYSVPYTREMRVLEALDYIVEELGESLAFQWYCGVKKCGMCGLMVNGRQTLSCWEPVEREMTIRPLDGFPVIRDLVIDRSKYVSDVQSLQPWMQRKDSYGGFPESIDGTQLLPAAEMMHCIECMLCVSACPANGDDFMGPAPMVQLAKFALDPRDGGARASAAIKNGGIDHCVGCHQCTNACPTGIPVFEGAIEGLRDQIAKAGLGRPNSLRSRLFANVHMVGHLGSRFARLANWVAGNGLARKLVERVFQIDRRRSLPRFSSVAFDDWFAKRPSRSSAGQKVVLFHDTFITYFEPEIGKAAVEFLEALNYQVALADGRKCCGRPLLSEGQKNAARSVASHNVRLLLKYADDGIPVIGLEPSCVLTIRNEYPKLLDGDDAKRVRDNLWTFEEFIAAEAEAGNVKLDFPDPPTEILLHGHCHQKSMIGTGPALTTLALSGAKSVAEIPSTCCGMAGSNGYECEHFDRSLEAAEARLLPAVREAPATTVIAAAGTSCRHQILDGTGRRALHPAQILNDALGRKSI